MSTIRIATNFNIDLEFPAAPFHRRLIAWLVDVTICYFYYLFMRVIGRGIDEQDSVLASVYLILFLVPLLTYHLVSEILLEGQSIGKRVLGIRVVNERGGKPAIGQFIIRWLIRTSDFMIIIIIFFAVEEARHGNTSFFTHIAAAFCLLLTDIILVNASKKRQRLGDMLAHTIMIRTKEEAHITQTIFQEVSDTYVPSFPQIMRLSDRDMNALKGILETAKRRGDYNMAELASEKIKGHLNIHTSLSAFEFLEVCLKDYNYLSSH